MGNVLPSWNDGDCRERILNSIDSMANDPNSSTFVPQEKRIAVFDNDGTLWCEKPGPVQLFFLVSRWKQMASADPSKRNIQPYKAAFENDIRYFADLYSHVPDLIAAVGASFSGITVEDFEKEVRLFLSAANHPRFKTALSNLSYKPMRELIDFLKENGFSVYITTGGGRDFVRSVSQNVYGLSKANVIGSSVVINYEGGHLVRSSDLRPPLDDGEGKPIHIFEYIGYPPVFAAGNADGDTQMLETARFSILLNHDDADREYSYSDGAEKVSKVAQKNGWQIVSMKNDFTQIFDLDAKRIPSPIPV